MIDFRYHLVSLMAVLVSLTLGIILGAGPLQGRISDTLSGEVDRLAKRQADLQADRDWYKLQNSQSAQAVSDLSAQLTPNLLSGENVAVVTLPDADNKYVTDLVEDLTHAGAQVKAQVGLTEAWGEKGESLTALAKNLELKLGGKIQDQTDQVTILAMALAQALQTKDLALLENLTDSKPALVESVLAPEMPATSLIIVGPESNYRKPDLHTFEPKVEESLIRGFIPYFNASALIVGASETNRDAVYELRNRKTKISTVDSVGSAISRLNVVLGLASTKAGTVGNWGTEQGAEQSIPTLGKILLIQKAQREAGKAEEK